MKAVKEAAQNGGVSTQRITTILDYFSSVFEIFPHFFELSFLCWLQIGFFVVLFEEVLIKFCNFWYFSHQIMRFDTSMESLIGIGRSESFADLNNSDFARSLLTSSTSLYGIAGEQKKLVISLMENFKAINNRPVRKHSRSPQFQWKVDSGGSFECHSQRWKTLRNQWVAQFPPFILFRSFLSYTQRNWTLKVFHKNKKKRFFPFGFLFCDLGGFFLWFCFFSNLSSEKKVTLVIFLCFFLKKYIKTHTKWNATHNFRFLLL